MYTATELGLHYVFMSHQDAAFYGRSARVLNFTSTNHPYKLFSAVSAFEIDDFKSFSSLHSFRGVAMGTHAPGRLVGWWGKTAGHIAGRVDRLAPSKIGDLAILLSQSIRHDGEPLGRTHYLVCSASGFSGQTGGREGKVV